MGFSAYLLPFAVTAQGGTLQRATQKIGKHTTEGYTTVLAAPYGRVRKAYWDYLSTFADLRIHRNYWELSVLIGADHPSGQKRIPVLFAQIERHEEGGRVYLGVPSASAPRGGRWEKEVAHTLFVFRLLFYEDELQRRIGANEREYLVKNKEAVVLEMRKIKWKRKVERYEEHPRLELWRQKLEEVAQALWEKQAALSELSEEKKSFLRDLANLRARSEDP